MESYGGSLGIGLALTISSVELQYMKMSYTNIRQIPQKELGHVAYCMHTLDN